MSKAAPETAEVTSEARLTALDAFRGAIMLLMASSGFGIPQIARQFPESDVWRVLGHQFEHAEWVGCTLWDLIQPAFMFMVGVALPWSIANRRRRGQTDRELALHALWRSLLLVLLAVFLTSAWSRRTDWVFTNVLAQIGLGYPVLFAFGLASVRTQRLGIGAILLLTWIAFAVHPQAPDGFDWSSVGVPAGWSHLGGFAAHWEKNYNAAASFDLWFLNLFPRETEFKFSSGGYQTLNFVPSIATMLLGTLAGQLLRQPGHVASKLPRLFGWGAAGIALGLVLGGAGICPVVKRIWTPSWVLLSGGLVVWMLAGMVALIEWRGWKRWSFPLVVAGLNPITLYCLWQLSGSFVRAQLRIHFGPGLFDLLGTTWTPLMERVLTLGIWWLILLWMHRRRLYIRI